MLNPIPKLTDNGMPTATACGSNVWRLTTTDICLQINWQCFSLDWDADSEPSSEMLSSGHVQAVCAYVTVLWRL